MKSGLITILAVGVLTLPAGAQDKTNAATAAKPALQLDAKPAPKTDAQKKEDVSYAIGMNIGNSFKRSELDVNVDTVVKALKDVLAGNPTRLNDQQAQETMMTFQTEMRAKQEAKMKEEGEKGKTEGAAYLATNAKKTGVKIHPVKLGDGKTAELQYEVLKEGTGPMPKTTDTVTVHYRGTLINGTEFDSSIKRGQPASFPVTGVIKGWTEALQLMKTGSKWKLTIPSELAYGEGGQRGIPPNSVLIFDVELISIKPPADESVQAVSGEIIKVPSADELKKGAKIEVIKPGDANSATNSKPKIK